MDYSTSFLVSRNLHFGSSHVVICESTVNALLVLTGSSNIWELYGCRIVHCGHGWDSWALLYLSCLLDRARLIARATQSDQYLLRTFPQPPCYFDQHNLKIFSPLPQTFIFFLKRKTSPKPYPLSKSMVHSAMLLIIDILMYIMYLDVSILQKSNSMPFEPGLLTGIYYSILITTILLCASV
jgi:hypothetical protein